MAWLSISLRDILYGNKIDVGETNGNLVKICSQLELTKF